MKSIQNLRNSLKFKAPIVVDSLAVVVEGRAYRIRNSEARIIMGEDHAYVSASGFSHIVELDGDEMLPLDDDVPSGDIGEELSPSVPRQRNKRKALEVPDDLKEMLLSSVPEGYRIQFDKGGEVRLVRTRNRGAKGAE